MKKAADIFQTQEFTFDFKQDLKMSVYASLKGYYKPTPKNNRAYHNLDHIGYCCNLLREVPKILEHLLPEMYAALLFHDAVYVPGEPDNEKKSFLLYKKLLDEDCDLRSLGFVEEMIMATVWNGQPPLLTTRPSAISWISEIDLSILGAEPDYYDTYSKSIRREFVSSGVSEYDFVRGRLKFLDGLLGKDLFYLPFFQPYNERLYSNISRERQSLLNEL